MYEGGIIIYLDESAEHGLVFALFDQSTGAEWGCFGTILSGAVAAPIGTKKQNTNDIELECSSAGTAKDVCANQALNGFSD